jgi:purine-binding chemotaxis protein CheW
MSQRLHVVFTVGDADYIVPASDVAQMESYDGATLVPGAPAFVAGVIQVRGRVVPVVDLRTRFGLPKVPHTLDTRVVVTERGGRVVGLLVDRAREVVLVREEQIEPPPAMIAAQAGGLVRAIATLGPRVLMVVDVPALIGEEQLHGN